MIWNHLLHLIAGIVGSSIFDFTGVGILTTIILTAFTQTIDIIRMYR